MSEPVDTTIWDSQKILNTLKGKTERVRLLIGIFMKESTIQIDELESNIGVRNYTLAFANAHTLKGMAANLNAQQLSASAKALEDACKAEDDDNIPKLYEELKQAQQKLEEQLKNFLQQDN